MNIVEENINWLMSLARLAFGKDYLATECIQILERLMPPELAEEFYQRYKQHGFNLNQEVPKLSDLCVDKVCTNDIVDCLFEIYGPDTNFAIRKLQNTINLIKKILYFQ